MRALGQVLGRRVGGSTGTNLWACAQLIREMAARGERGSIVTLLCDGGDRYGCTYHDPAWLAESGLAWARGEAEMAGLLG
jgi:cysteine synthase A